MMKKLYFKVIFILISCLVQNTTFAQDSPYYERPTERQLTNNEIALPNLKTEKVYWYFGANGGMKLQKQTVSNDLNGTIGIPNINTTYWEAFFGINNNDRWQAELGYIHNPFSQDWQLKDKSGLRIPIQFRNSEINKTIALRYKRRVLTLDKVTKNSRLNLTGGLQYSPDRKTKTLGYYRFREPIGRTQNGYSDTLYVNSELKQKKAALSAELGIELISRLAAPIEIGIFGKYVLNARDIFSSDIEIDTYSGEPQNTQLSLNPGTFMLGVTLRWNFLHGIRYISEIE